MTFINKQYEAYLAYLKTLETFLVNNKQGNINPAKNENINRTAEITTRKSWIQKLGC